MRIFVLVCAGYYLGARVGFALTFQPLPVSVLWPCNAILFASMLLLPANAWWLVAAAALPAHLVSELMGGIPLAMVLCWYLSNVTQALIAASIVRMLWGTASPFTAPGGVLVFLGASLTATSLSSFLDSAFVALNNFSSEGYWSVWTTRLLSNIVADLVVVPIIVTAGFARWHQTSRSVRIDEAAILFTSLAGITLLVVNSDLALAAPAAQVCLPIPFLLWAAMRFGPGGASIAFTFVSVVTIWGAGHGIGALASGTPIQNASSVQIYLLCIGPTLLFLAAAIHRMRSGFESLQLSERRFRLVLEATRDVVYEREMASGRLWWNQDGRRHLGYLHEEDLDDFGELEEIMHPQDRTRAEEVRSLALAGGEPVWQTEFRVRRPNGTYLHLHEHGFIVRDAAGNPTHMIGALKDITERLDHEERNHQLARQSHRTAMGEFAAIVAHEVKQPMTAILANVEAGQILLDSGRDYKREIEAILESIRADDMRATEVLSHICNFANKGELTTVPLDMDAVVRSVARLAMPTASRRGVDIHLSSAGIPVIHADRVNMQQVLLNLILNALDAMRDTPPEARVIEIGTRSAGTGGVEVSVSDRGHGIPQEALDRIFDSFFTTKADGMGLGLAIAQSLVVAHGGRIWAENNPHGGATFRFTIPAGPPGK